MVRIVRAQGTRVCRVTGMAGLKSSRGYPSFEEARVAALEAARACGQAAGDVWDEEAALDGASRVQARRLRVSSEVRPEAARIAVGAGWDRRVDAPSDTL